MSASSDSSPSTRTASSPGLAPAASAPPPRLVGGALAAGARPGEDAVRVDGEESDEALMTAYRAGETRAFERLLARHEKPVWIFLRRFSRDAEAAEDLLQEVFLRVVKDAQESEAAWKGTAKFSTWLYTIARNLCIDRARRAAHRD